MALSVAIAAGGIYVARMVYLRRAELAEQWKAKFPKIYAMLFNKYYVDEAYDAVVITPTVKVSEAILWKGVDVSIIDGLVNGSAKLIGTIAQGIRRVQTGIAQQYATIFVGGILVILIWLILK
jgi:NADH-quinone oxidoreductase subunit L